LEKLGKQVEGTRDTWHDAMKKLRDGSGNLLSRAERLRKLGIKANKRLPSHLLGHDNADADESAPGETEAS
jgi:DNA recombination protein RmuC